LGYAGEIAPTLRSLHEASQLLGVITLPGEDALLKKGLDGKYVSRGEVMAASDGRARAASVDLFGWYVAELVSIGGSALGHLLGVEWAQTRFQPTFHKLIELKARVPLDDLARGKVGVATKAT